MYIPNSCTVPIEKASEDSTAHRTPHTAHRKIEPVKIAFITVFCLYYVGSFAQSCPSNPPNLCLYGYNEVNATYHPQGVVNPDGEMVASLILSDNQTQDELQFVNAISIIITVNPSNLTVGFNETKTSLSLHPILKSSGWVNVQYPPTAGANTIRISGFYNDQNPNHNLVNLKLVDEIIKIYYTGPAGQCFTNNVTPSYRFEGQPSGPPCVFEFDTGCNGITGCFPFITLAGKIQSYPTACNGSNNFGLEEATVYLYDENPFGSGAPDPIMTTLTDDDGDYSFSPLEPGGDYWVVPEKHHNPNCGLDMIDLDLLWQHLLLNYNMSPWERFVGNVADIESHEITSYDAFGLNARINSAIPYPHPAYSKSWFFIKNTDFTNWILLGNPPLQGPMHVPPVDPFYQLTNVANDQLNLNFKAGKAGDIHPTCTTCHGVLKGEEDDTIVRSIHGQPVLFGTLTKEKDSDLISMPLYMPGANQKQLWQLLLQYDDLAYAIENVELHATHNPAFFLWETVEDRLHILSLPDPGDQTQWDIDYPAFTVNYRKIDPSSNDHLAFSMVLHPAGNGIVVQHREIYPWLLNPKPEHLDMASAEILLFPNPTADLIYLKSSDTWRQPQMSLFDVKGAQVWTTILPDLDASSVVIVPVHDLPSGTYHYSLSAEGQHSSGLVVIQK